MTDEEVKTILSGNIRHLRSVKGLSQQELAEKCNLSVPYLSALERAEKFPSASSLGTLADALEVTLSDLFKTDMDTEIDKDYKVVLKQYFESQKESLEKLCDVLK